MRTISDNFKYINDKIDKCCNRSGRKFEDIRLIVVTKKQPVTKIMELIYAGANRFGENYPEELGQKIQEIGTNQGIEWHMLGHIQSRKIKIVADYFSYVHSIDSIELASKLNKVCSERGISLPVMMEVNLSGETTKYGFKASEITMWGMISERVTEILGLENLKLIGLMTMPPYSTQKEANRKYFRKCRQLLDYINSSSKLDNFVELSMGTSNDFEDAIEEGATYIRIGEAILGKRPNSEEGYN